MKMMSTLVKLGAFVVVTVMAGALVAFTAGDLRVGSTKDYTAEFTDASGISKGSDVRIAGVPRGKVQGVELQENTVVKVKFSLASDVAVQEGTKAAIRYKNLIGDRYLELSREPGTNGPLIGNVPVSDTTPALDVDEVVNGFRPLLRGLDPDQANALTGSLLEVLNGREAAVSSLVSDLAALTNTIADRDESVGAIIANFNTVLKGVAQRSGEVDSLITGVNSLVGGLSGDRVRIVNSLTNIDHLTASIDDLLGPARPDIASAVSGLRDLSANLNKNTNTLNMILGSLPKSYQILGRVAGYGNFVNFFVCGLAIRYGPTPNEQTPMFTAPASRCKP